MPKAERGTPKDIANKMKAKGLQKLKFYCQMCNKQCRDENGFKCHLTSDSHLRQMKVFAENAGEFLDSFSSEFEQAYMDTLRRRHGTKKMNANNVYQEVIQDKHHVHMNSTKWATLTDFVQYLGKTGKCVVEETERGWYVTYIERDPALLARQEAHRRRVESERAEEEKAAKRMEKQRVEAAKAVALAGGSVEVSEASKMERSEDDKPVALTIGGGAANSTAGGGGGLDGLTGKKRKKSGSTSGDAKKVKAVFGGDDDDDVDDEDQDRKIAAKPTSNGNGDAKPAKLVEAAAAAQAGAATAALESSASKSEGRSHTSSSSGAALVSSTSKQKPEVNLLIATATAACIYDADARRKCRDEDYYRRKAFKMAGGDGGDGVGSGGKSASSSKGIDDIRKDYWIRRNIVVRIISKKISGKKYYKRKGVIIRVIDRYMAEVEILDTAPDAKDGGDLIRIDQDDLETVVPKEGKECRILNGRGRGKRAEVVSLDKAKYRGTLKILDSGEVVEKIHYEDFSKIA
jgi:DNA/RNA-binding protein KIN17